MAEVSRKEKVWGVVPRSEKRDGWHSIYKLIQFLMRAPWKALYLRSEKILKKWAGGKSVKTVKLLEGGPEDCQPGQTILVSATHLFSVPNKHRHCIDVWALDTAKYLHRLAGHKGPVEIVELSESGPLLASSAVNDTILRVWDINTAHCLLKLQHTECPKFRLHGQRLIVADKVEHDIREHLDCEIVTDNWGRCESFKLHVYDPQTGLKIKSVCGIDGEGEVTAMEFNEDYLVTGHGYSNLSLPKIKVPDHDLNCLKTWTHNQNFKSHRIMLDKASSTIITYDHELCPVCPVHEPCSVIVWSMEGVMKSRVLTMPKGSINQMHVHVAVIANRVFVYISKQKHTDIIKILMEVLRYLGAKHLGVLAAVSKDWRKMAEDKQLWHEMCKRYTRVDWNSLPPPPPGYDSRMLIRAPWKALYLRSEKILKKWAGGKSVKTVKLLEGGPEDCQPGQTVLVSATHLFSVPNKHRHCIDMWALDTAKYLHRLAGHKGPVEIVELSESGPLLASSAVDDTILRVWDINTAHCLLKLQHTECPKFRLHGQRLIVADKVEHDIREHLDCEIITDNWGRCESFKLHVYDLQMGLKIKSVCGIDGEGEVTAMEFNEDYLVTGHGYSNLSLPKIKVWDHDLNCLKTWTHNQNFESHRIMLDKASSTIITYDHELCPVCPVHEPCSVIVWSMEGVMKSRVLTMPKGSINQMHVHVAVIANRVFVYISKQKHTDIIKVLKLPSGRLLQEIVAGSIESRQLFFKYHTATLLQTYPIRYHQIFVHLFLPLYLNDLYEDELTEEQNKDDAKKKRKRKLARKISSKVDATLAGAMLMRSYMIKGAADIYAYIQRVVRAFPWSVLGFPKARNAERNECEENENGYSDSDDSSDNSSTDGSDGSSADDEGSDADDEQGNIEQAQAQDQILAFYRREEHAHPYVQQMFLPGGDNAADLRERGVPVHDARGGDDDGHIEDNGDNIRPVVERMREFNREMRRAGMRDRDLERLVGEGDVEINLEEDEHNHHEHACFDRMHIERTQLYFFLKPRKEDYDNYFRKFITLDYNCPFPHPL